jgi:hypothetical protein
MQTNDIALYIFLTCVYAIPVFGLVTFVGDYIRKTIKKEK